MVHDPNLAAFHGIPNLSGLTGNKLEKKTKKNCLTKSERNKTTLIKIQSPCKTEYN
jgi:hypothetical protein